MSVTSAVAVGERGTLGRDIAVVGTVSAAHFWSHFFQFTLPVLYPRIQQEYGVSFAEIGLVMSVFYACSGVAQTGAGFVVDRVGPARVLAAGLLLLIAGMAIIALVPTFWMMYPAAALAGLGNSVFHPADYSIMNRRVASSRVGRAFAVHNLSGMIGYAAAPAALVGLGGNLPWRHSVLLAVAGAFVVFLLLLVRQHLLTGAETSPKPARPAQVVSPLAALRHPTVLVCFGFFFLMAVPTVGLAGFLMTALGRLFATPAATVAMALSANLIGGALGVMAGGILADRTRHHERTVAIAVAVAAGVYLGIGAAGFGALMLATSLIVAGFCNGIAAPSRDMLVREAAAASGGTGKIFGFAYSGFDLGSAAAPPLLGFLVDHGHEAWVLPTMALSLVLVIVTALGLRKGGVV
jgi:MFS family permease